MAALIQRQCYCFGDHKSLLRFKQTLAEKECNQMRTQLQETRNIADDLEKVSEETLCKNGCQLKISPTNLAFELIIQRNFYFQTRLVGLI